MNKYIAFSALLATTSSAYAATTVMLDTKGAEAWLSCTEAQGIPEQCNAASAATEGGKLAELAIPTFGKLPTEHPADPSTIEAKMLLQTVKSWNLDQLTGDIQALFPKLRPHTASIFIVGSGAHDWGDAYVRNYSYRNGTAVLDDNGKPIILINLRLIARYKGTTSEKAEILRSILRHELFHIHFAWDRSESPAWVKLGALNKQQEFLLLVQDEGIAHFLADEQNLRANGFPPDRAQKALANLSGAVEALKAGTASEELLLAANQGPYWDKYAAISGALFAYGIAKIYGAEGLKQSLAHGPAGFLRMYENATQEEPRLPKLPGILKSWAADMREMNFR